MPLHSIYEGDGSLATPPLRTPVAGTGPARPHRIATERMAATTGYGSELSDGCVSNATT